MNHYYSQRQAILAKMENITHMERGHLSAEHRKGKDGGQAGPYFKHQAWEKGRNHSCRVPVDQVETLRQALAAHQRFRELADEYVEVTVAMTRAESADANKKKSKLSSKHVIRKPKSS